MELEVHYIYLITNIINQKKYVGKTNDLERRWHVHKKIAIGGLEMYSDKFSVVHAAIQKHGVENFSFSILEEFDNESKAYEYETWWIDYLGSHTSLKKGYNCNYGGIGGLSPNQETKDKISAAHKGKIVSDETKAKISKIHLGKILSDDTKKKISESSVGELNHFYGKNHSQESIVLISKSRTGIYCGEEHYLFGETLPEETRQKISDSRRGKTAGETNPAAKVTEKIVLEIREKHATGILNQKQIAKEYNISEHIVSRIINRKTWKHI